MKRATLLMIMVALMVALSAGTALAALNKINCPNKSGDRCVGTPNDDQLGGTNRADKQLGRLGNDLIIGFGGNDLQKGSSGNDTLQGGPGNDKLLTGIGRDDAHGAMGDDSINVSRDEDADYAYCGAGYDTVRLDANDVIGDPEGPGGIRASRILAGVNPVFNCELIIVNGTIVVQVPRL